MKLLLSSLVLLSSLSLQAAITIGTYNIRNFDYDQRYRIRTNKSVLESQLKGMNADVVSVQEINNTAEFERFVATKLPGYDTELSRCGGEHGQNLGFLYNKNKVDMLAFNEDLSISNPGGQGTCNSGSRPMAIALFQIRATKQKFYGISVHLKSGSQASSIQKRSMQYQIIKNTIADLRSRTGVRDFYVAGDFNTTEYIHRGTDYVELNKVARDLGMVDFASNLKCTAYWWGGTDDGIETPSVLDHLLITRGLIKAASPRVNLGGHCQTVSCREAPVRNLGDSYAGVSDHCPITATVQ
ncbi:MAG: endonuclease/exonuclease/phosphatase family protein [Bacteriovoracia bacterium]